MAIYAPESFYETTLASALTAAATTISVTSAPNITSGYLVIEANTSNREIIKYTGVSGTTLTGCTRGLAEYGSDDSGGTGIAHPAGVDIANRDVHYYYAQYYDFLTGTSATGANSMKIGDGNALSSANRLWYVNTDSLSAFWGLSSSGQMVVSEDGITSYVISAGGSGLAAGEGTAITTGTINVDRLSTGGLALSANKLAVGVSSLMFRTSNSIGVDTTSAMEWSGTQSFTAVSATSMKLSSYDVDLALFNGGDATSLHTHSYMSLYDGYGALSAHTGDTNETTLYSSTLSANDLGANDAIRINLAGTITGDAGSIRSMTVKFGGSAVLTMTVGSENFMVGEVIIQNRNATGSQYYSGFYLLEGQSIPYSYRVQGTTSIDTTSDVTILVTGTLNNGSDTITLQRITVEIIK